MGGNKLSYDHETVAPAANLLEAKIIFKSTISTPGAKFFTMDITDFFLSSKMTKPEYMKMHVSEIQDDIIMKYNLPTIQDSKGYVYFQIDKGMHGSKQATIPAYQQLRDHLVPFCYHPIPNIVGL